MTRERLLHLLAEASELEHNLLCSYLFAVFSLKRRQDEQLTPEEFAAVQRWRKDLLSVCVEEMVHLTQVANLTAALGAVPHFDRPNLPAAPGYHPAQIVVELTPFNAETLKHFVFLERPDTVALEDPAVFSASESAESRRAQAALRLTPSAPEYATVGEFYGVLRQSLIEFVDTRGDEAFHSESFQLDGQAIDSPTLVVVRTLDDAVLAIDRIVEQGEGADQHAETSHFSRFSAMLDELTRLKAARAAFEPARRVGANPVMRAPQAEERTPVTAPDALACLDAFNAVYWMMLRTLTALYAHGADGDDPPIAPPLVDHMLGCMHLMSALADPLTAHAADEAQADVMAGPSFTMFRHAFGAATGPGALRHLRERCAEIATGVGKLPIAASVKTQLQEQLAAMSDSLAQAQPQPA